MIQTMNKITPAEKRMKERKPTTPIKAVGIFPATRTPVNKKVHTPDIKKPSALLKSFGWFIIKEMTVPTESPTGNTLGFLIFSSMEGHDSARLTPDSSLRDILTDFPKVDFALAYGSGVVPQNGYTALRPLKSKKQQEMVTLFACWLEMYDFIFGVENAEEWHKENLEVHKNHYSFLMRCCGPSIITRVQVFRIHFNLTQEKLRSIDVLQFQCSLSWKSMQYPSHSLWRS